MSLGPGDNTLGEGQWSHRKGQFSEGGGLYQEPVPPPPALACETACENQTQLLVQPPELWATQAFKKKEKGLDLFHAYECYAPVYICVYHRAMDGCELSRGCGELNLSPL